MFEDIVNKFDILRPFTEGQQYDQDSTKVTYHSSERSCVNVMGLSLHKSAFGALFVTRDTSQKIN